MIKENNKLKNYPMLSGLKLGMLLQFGGMGPISLLMFQLAAVLPLPSMLLGIIAVTLADAIYILVSLLGIVGIIKQVKSTSDLFKKINGAIIVYLGLSFALMSFMERDSYLDLYDWNAGNVFVGVLVLTMLNPVTIVCYTGIFNAKLMDLKMSNKNLFWFGLGTLVTTPIFMTVLVLLGAFGGAFLPEIVVNIMNLIVGALLVWWGIKYIFPQLNKEDKKSSFSIKISEFLASKRKK